MKRNYFYFAASALVLSACTSENVVEDITKDRNVISFENVVKKPTRADRVEDISAGSLSQFNVFGFYVTPSDPYKAYEIFDDVLVKRHDSDWIYANADENIELRYWLKGNKYYFYAYNCGNKEKLSSYYGTFTLNMDNKEKLSAAERVLIINNYLCDHTHQHDLIYASNVGGSDYAGIEALESGNAHVALQFNHILSKVNARFTSKFPEEYEVIIKNVAIQNIRNIGNYHPVSGWQEVKRTKTGDIVDMPYINLATAIRDADGNQTSSFLSVKNEVDNKGNQVYVDSEIGFVIPWGYQGDATASLDEDNKVYFTFDIEVLNQGNTVLTKSLKAILNPTWLVGYFYTYNVELSGSSTNMDAIVFTTVTDKDGRVVDWQKGDIVVGIEN